MTKEELISQLEELLNELEDVASEVSGFDLDATSELKTALDEAEQAKSNAEDVVSNLEEAISNLEAISLPDPSDLEELGDRVSSAVKSIKELTEEVANQTPKSLTLIVKQGSAEQRFYLHPDQPVQIEIVQD